MSGERETKHDLRQALVEGTATDTDFDALLPERAQMKSKRFWTPLAVAARAAQLFADRGSTSVLDVGSGPGKFCLALAAASPHLVVTGIEQRPELVEVARCAAKRLNVTNVRFILDDVSMAAWKDFDGFYFYNSFGENFFDAHDRFDDSVELSEERFITEILLVERALLDAPIGTTVLTYHGFGGRMPRCYTLATEEVFGSNILRAWRKASVGREADGAWLELSDGGIAETRFRKLSVGTLRGPT
jgi:SAM-dependent methyltransferase